MYYLAKVLYYIMYNTVIMNYPHISVIIPSYDINELVYLRESIDSILEQNYSNFDIVVITEGDELTNEIKDSHGDIDIVSIIQISNDDGGLSVARNEGIKQSDGEIIAYIDSDAVADSNWLNNIGEIYANDESIIAVGGKAIPDWQSKRPWYLPDSFLWLVGITHEGHPDSGTIIRNTFGCNISYRRYIFDEIAGFTTDLGKSHGFNLQGEESELGSRIIEKYDTGMYYEEDAIVKHKVDEHQTTFNWLSKRAYLQGITKSIMNNKNKDTTLDTEEDYLKNLYLNHIPNYIKSILKLNNVKKSLGSIIGIIYFTFLVGVGFIRGSIYEITN